MNEIIIMIICLITLILLKIGLDIKFKKIKKLKIQTNIELKKVAEKFPEDKKICEDILNKLNNSNVKIAINEEYDSCLYTVYNNTITIGKFKEQYMKLQTIAHECLHSCQSKVTLWFHFIFSNICIIYFLVISILTLLNKINNVTIQAFILLVLVFIKCIVRLYLENEAMIKAEYVSKEYIEENNILDINEEERLLKEYRKVNKIGVPFYNYMLIANELIKVIIFVLIALGTFFF